MKANINSQVLLDSVINIATSGSRALLALIGIAAGCAAVVALLNIGKNAADESISIYKGLGTSTLVATFPPVFDDIPAPDRIDISKLQSALPLIASAAPILTHSSFIQGTLNAKEQISVIGTTNELAVVLKLEMNKGRFLSEYDRDSAFAVIGATLADELSKTKSSFGLGDKVSISGYLYTVIGVIEDTPQGHLSPVRVNESVFITAEGMRRLKSHPEISSIIAIVSEPAEHNAAARDLKKYLDTISAGRPAAVEVAQQLLDSLSRQTRTFTYLMGGLGALSLLVGGVGVMNVMLMNVRERRREIGVRMALGARASDIRNLFLCEAIIISMTGSVIGVTTGLMIAYFFVSLSGWSFSISASSIPIAVFSSVTIGLFFGIHPAITAARLEPIEALRDD